MFAFCDERVLGGSSLLAKRGATPPSLALLLPVVGSHPLASKEKRLCPSICGGHSCIFWFFVREALLGLALCRARNIAPFPRSPCIFFLHGICSWFSLIFSELVCLFVVWNLSIHLHTSIQQGFRRLGPLNFQSRAKIQLSYTKNPNDFRKLTFFICLQEVLIDW